MTAIHYPEPDFTAEPPTPPLTVVEAPRRSRSRRTPIIIAVALLVTLAAAAAAWTSGRSDSASVYVPGFAEMYVRTFLTQAGEGNEAAIIPFLGYEPDLSGMQPGSFYVTGAAALTAEDLGDGFSNVVVAVDQMGAVSGGFAPEGIHYYEVTVQSVDGTVRATRLPSQISAPTIGADLPNQQVFAHPSDGPMGSSISAYLEWYLADGDGAYGSERPAEAPYTDIAVTGIAAPPDAGAADVTVAATDSQGRVVHLQYRLNVTNENGMWVAGPGW